MISLTHCSSDLTHVAVRVSSHRIAGMVGSPRNALLPAHRWQSPAALVGERPSITVPTVAHSAPGAAPGPAGDDAAPAAATAALAPPSDGVDAAAAGAGGYASAPDSPGLGRSSAGGGPLDSVAGRKHPLLPVHRARLPALGVPPVAEHGGEDGALASSSSLGGGGGAQAPGSLLPPEQVALLAASLTAACASAGACHCCLLDRSSYTDPGGEWDAARC